MKETKHSKKKTDLSLLPTCNTSTCLTGLIIAGFCLGLALTQSTAIMVILACLLILAYLHLIKSE